VRIDPRVYKTPLVVMDGDEAVELAPEQSRQVMSAFLQVRRQALHWRVPTQQGFRVVLLGELGVAVTTYLAGLADQREEGSPKAESKVASSGGRRAGQDPWICASFMARSTDRCRAGLGGARVRIRGA